MAAVVPVLFGGRNKPRVAYDFLSGSLPSNMTFSRASNATMFDSTGSIITAANNVPRFDHDPVSLAPRGLLVEGQRTNLCTRSYQIASWTDNGTLSTDNNIYVSPDGTQNASRIVVDTQNKGRYRFSTVSAATFYAVSGYVKYFDGDPIWRVGTENTEDTPAQGMLIINTQTGALVGAGSKTYSPYVVMLPSGWVYFRYYVKTGAAQTSVSLVIFAQINVAGNRTISLWGVQLEAGITATSYIPTAGEAVTRVADQAYFASNSPWYNPTEGTLYMETMVPYTATSARAYMAAFTDGTSNTLEGGFYETNGKPTGGAVISGTAYLSGQALAGTSAFAVNKSVIGYKSGDNRFATNGVLDTAGDLGALSVPSGMNKLWLGNRTALDGPLNGWVRRVRYWNRRLTDSELVRLST